MTYTAKFNMLKDFNPDQLEQEIASLDLPEGFTVLFPGFDEKDENAVAPADLTRPRVMPTIPLARPISIVSKATKGDVHFLTFDKLTAKQVTDIDAKLIAHDSKTKSPRQLRRIQKRADLVTLRAKVKGAGVTVADLNLMARLILRALD